LRIFKGGISVTHNVEHLVGPHTLLLFRKLIKYVTATLDRVTVHWVGTPAI
jgi:hypothetical protein